MFRLRSAPPPTRCLRRRLQHPDRRRWRNLGRIGRRRRVIRLLDDGERFAMPPVPRRSLLRPARRVHRERQLPEPFELHERLHRRSVPVRVRRQLSEGRDDPRRARAMRDVRVPGVQRSGRRRPVQRARRRLHDGTVLRRPLVHKNVPARIGLLGTRRRRGKCLWTAERVHAQRDERRHLLPGLRFGFGLLGVPRRLLSVDHLGRWIARHRLRELSRRGRHRLTVGWASTRAASIRRAAWVGARTPWDGCASRGGRP